MIEVHSTGCEGPTTIHTGLILQFCQLRRTLSSLALVLFLLLLWMHIVKSPLTGLDLIPILQIIPLLPLQNFRTVPSVVNLPISPYLVWRSHDANIALAFLRIRAFSDGLRAWRIRARAARAWPLSGIGYARRSGTAKVEVRRPLRAFAVSLAIMSNFRQFDEISSVDLGFLVIFRDL